MRATAKLKAASQTALDLKIGIYGTAQELYSRLAAHNYAWDSTTGKWEPTKRPVRTDGTKSESMFSTEDNTPSGVYRLRIMGHPADMDRLTRLLQERLDIFEVSDQYPNRKGDGVRVYLSGKLPQKKGR